MENLKDLELNYGELSYIMELPVAEAKAIYLEISKQEKIKRDHLLKVSELIPFFGNVTSLDRRYDGQNELLFNLAMKKANYKKHLSDKPCIKKKDFTGGKTIFHKILSEAEIKHALDTLASHHRFLFSKKNAAA